MAKAGTHKGRGANRKFLVGLCRAAAGSIIFALPLLMTMETWQLGQYMDPLRLVLFSLLSLPLLVGCSHIVGFEETFDWRNDVVDVLVAEFVAFLTALAVLGLMAVLGKETSTQEFVQKILLQMVPGSFGALLAQSELTSQNDDDDQEKEKGNGPKKREPTYISEIFLMATGALFLSFSIAPTEEVILIANRMTHAQGLLMICVCLLIMHSFVYALGFKGSHQKPEHHGFFQVFFKFTVVGCAIALLMSAYILWTFHRSDGLALAEYVQSTIVLSFPATVGAAAARLII